MKRHKLLVLAAASICALPLLAQTSAPAVSADAPTPSTATLSEKKDLISVDFPNEEIRTILRNVADMFELNLVVPETLQGRTSIKLRNVTWRQIFREVLGPVNYTFIEDENIIRVVSVDALAQEPNVTEVYILNYAEASKVLPTVSGMVETADPVKGRIQVDQRNNALVITERPSRQEKIKPIIAKLDVATAQVMIESKFIEVSNEDGSDVGMNWSSLKNLSVKQGPIESTAQHTKTTTTYTQNPNTGLYEATSTTAYEEGATSGNWANSLNSLFNAPHLVTSTFSISEFGAVLSLYESQSNVRLVSNPTVVTLNNVEATINIGEEYPIPNYTYNQEQGSFEISGFTYKPIGINLKVTPQINNAGFIKMNILPEVSSRSGEVSFGGASGASIPIISTRKAVTQISLKNGHTLGIGGLLQNQKTKGKSKVPVIGEIPVLGSLFKSKSEALSARNLVIFITAKTLDNGEAKVDEVFSREQLEGAEIERKDIPGQREHIPALSN
ncbi:MAG: secretin N-terminal domain-containing protein [Opitutaceae bacterium]